MALQVQPQVFLAHTTDTGKPGSTVSCLVMGEEDGESLTVSQSRVLHLNSGNNSHLTDLM